MKSKKINVDGTQITIMSQNSEDYISLTDIIKAKDGDFFIADWLTLSDIEEKIKFLSKKCKRFENLMDMPGIRLINSSALVSAIGDAKQFSSARGFAAFLGLVPKHEQSGTKLKSMGISKNGNCYLRTLLIHGARAIVNRYQNTDDPLKKFAMKIKEKRDPHKAYVAVAHKMSRIIWAMLTKDQAYNPDYILTRK